MQANNATAVLRLCRTDFSHKLYNFCFAPTPPIITGLYLGLAGVNSTLKQVVLKSCCKRVRQIGCGDMATFETGQFMWPD